MLSASFAGRGSTPHGSSPVSARVAAAVVLLLWGTACGEEDDGVTYRDVEPLLTRCTVCHRSGSPIGVDIARPFAEGTGLVNSRNSWHDDQPDGNTPEFNVVPGDPDNSFLLWKVAPASLGQLPAPELAGAPMPLVIPPLSGNEIAILEQWVTAGASPGGFFEGNVRPIFGDELQLDDTAGKCVACHYSGTPNPPDLTNPFGPDGIVDVQAKYDPALVRVRPGSPEESLLILKVRARDVYSTVGAPMPYSYSSFTVEEYELLWQWVEEGARP